MAGAPFNNPENENDAGGPKSEPAFNVPGIILVSIVLIIGVHLLRNYVLSDEQAFEILVRFAFIPMRYDEAALAAQGLQGFPDGFLGGLWTPFTYTFLHGDWLHLLINTFWLLAFGSALARRFGVFRFLLISMLGSLGGAMLHLPFHWGELVPMVGASAAISAHMGCMVRFAFVPYGPLGKPRSTHPGAYFLPALSLVGVFKNTQALTFLMVWFAINLIFGLGGSGVLVGEGASIAWQAHIGGFLVGFILFPLLDPARNL